MLRCRTCIKTRAETLKFKSSNIWPQCWKRISRGLPHTTPGAIAQFRGLIGRSRTCCLRLRRMTGSGPSQSVPHFFQGYKGRIQGGEWVRPEERGCSHSTIQGVLRCSGCKDPFKVGDGVWGMIPMSRGDWRESWHNHGIDCISSLRTYQISSIASTKRTASSETNGEGTVPRIAQSSVECKASARPSYVKKPPVWANDNQIYFVTWKHLFFSCLGIELFDME